MSTFFSFSGESQENKVDPYRRKAVNSNSSWQQEPRAITDLPEAQQSIVPEYRNHWHQTRTRFSSTNRLLDRYNYRLSSLQPQLETRQQRTADDSDDEGEDLIDKDEEEEDIESETEEDRAFIGDDVEEKGASFYRTLDR